MQNGESHQSSSSNVIGITASVGKQLVTSAHEVMLRTVALVYEADSGDSEERVIHARRFSCIEVGQ